MHTNSLLRELDSHVQDKRAPTVGSFRYGSGCYLTERTRSTSFKIAGAKDSERSKKSVGRMETRFGKTNQPADAYTHYQLASDNNPVEQSN